MFRFYNIIELDNRMRKKLVYMLKEEKAKAITKIEKM